MTIVSYAQNCEDVLLHRVFGGQETGFYIDVGAFHPVIGSVTKTFYDRGWNGINIEPGSVFAELANARPHDINLRMAVLDHAGEIAFIEDAVDRGMSHVALDGDDKGAARMVPCDTLEGIVGTYARGRPVDFIKVDAEGAEAAIVRSTDWRRLRPRVLVIEATLPWSSTLVNEAWEPELLRQGYIRAYFDGINCFYIPEEDVPVLMRHFQAPVNVLDRVERHETILLRSAVETLQREKGLVVSQQEAALDRLRADQEAMRAALDDQRSVVARLTAERDQHRGEIATMSATIEAQRQGLDLMTAERDHWRDEAARPPTAEPAAPASLPSAPQPSGAGSALQRLALAAYRVVRPVVRPVVWRLRGFMVAGLTEQLHHQSDKNDRILQQLNEGVTTIGNQNDRILQQLNEELATINDRIAVLSILPPPAPVAAESPSAAEMRRLAGEMEAVLLTLAMERMTDNSSVPFSGSARSRAGVSEPALSAADPNEAAADKS